MHEAAIVDGANKVMGIHCPLADKVPDDWFFIRHGKRAVYHGRYQLDYRNPNVRKYADEVIDRFVRQYGVGYIDTRSVGTILSPQESVFRMISDDEYIDEWGIRRIYTGQYWDIVEYPLKGASATELDSYPWPSPESVNRSEIENFEAAAKELWENTDYIVCAEHPVAVMILPPSRACSYPPICFVS